MSTGTRLRVSGSSSTALAIAPQSRARQLVADYVDLTKPKVQSLLLLTTVTTMEVAGSPSVSRADRPDLPVAGTCRQGGAGAVNHYWYDRDIDGRMASHGFDRPIPSGRVSPRAALTFGCVSRGAVSFVLMSLTLNVLAASLAFAGFVGYVGVYTIWLKRRTHQNIVIGGAAGRSRRWLAGRRCAARCPGPPIYLFAIVFYWTPSAFLGAEPADEGRVRRGGRSRCSLWCKR